MGFVCLFGCNSCFKFFTYALTERQTINSARNVLQANDFHHIDVHSHILMHIVYHLLTFWKPCALEPLHVLIVVCYCQKYSNTLGTTLLLFWDWLMSLVSYSDTM